MTAEATVLIVDDEPRVLDSLEALLAMDYRVLRADGPEAALEILAREAVALVISDQRMPGMSGTELLARCRKVAPETVRVLLTAFTDADALMESINAANIYHFILKPWDPTELTHTVRRGVERHRLAAERALLLRDLAAKNVDLEATLTDLRAAQERIVREAGVRAQLQRYVSPRLTWRSATRVSSTSPASGGRPPCSSPTSAATPASSRRRPPRSSSGSSTNTSPA